MQDIRRKNQGKRYKTVDPGNINKASKQSINEIADPSLPDIRH